MRRYTRRVFIRDMAIGGLGMAGTSAFVSRVRADTAKRRFTMDLACGRIGVRANLQEAIRLAHANGFESVEPPANQLAKLSATELHDLRAEMANKNLVWGAAGLPVDFRKDDERFRAGLAALPPIAQGLQRAGVTRVGTWISPNHDSRTYIANFKQHASRLREVAKILGDFGQRFGLEYVGPKTLWTASRHAFIHSMAETKELIAEIRQSNVGFVLDSWHWYTAHETGEDLLTLTNEDVVACDLNDAPAGVPVDEQVDNRRELPAATGVIDLKSFLKALVEIGYDGPVRAEPFNRDLNAMDNEPATAATAVAMKKAFALVN
ncbi:MAG: sugar phosphate isomerase/epimerase family protein [Pirellulaceae bacterium]